MANQAQKFKRQKVQRSEKPDYLNLIKVQTGTQIQFIPVSQVFYFRAEDKYTIVQAGQKELKIRLDPEQFWQVRESDRLHGIV